MKRSLGLHCGILRLNSVHNEKDALPIGKSTWISAGEELAYLANPGVVLPTISSDDRDGLLKFTRDMVTQSIVPHMERCITMWNDQVTHRHSTVLLIWSDSIVSTRSSRESIYCISSTIQYFFLKECHAHFWIGKLRHLNLVISPINTRSTNAKTG